ncbi:MAG: TonB family protein [Salinibacter sp.]
MIQTTLDLLADLGATTLDPLWLPVLAWTGLALPFWILLARTDRLHPNAEYRLWQVLLAALPIGIVAVSIVESLPSGARPPALPPQPIVVLPAVELASPSAAPPTWSWMHTVGLLTIGVLAIGLFQVARLLLDLIAVGRAQWRLATTSTPSLQAKTQRLAAQLNVRRPAQLCVSSTGAESVLPNATRVTPTAAVPLTLGGLRPTILVPAQLTDAPDALEMTLRHELVHIRRWDDLAHVAERLVAALFAAHPLVGRLCRRIARTRERACDAAVLADGRTRAAPYARLLTTFAEGTPPSRLGALTLSESPSSLIDRLSAMRSSMPSLLSSRLALGSALVAVGLALTLGVVACSDSIGPAPTSKDEESTTPKTTTASNSDGPVYMVVQNQPELVRGMQALQDAVSYPKTAKEAGIEGRVIVQFVVDKTGDVVNPKVTRGVNEALNQAALEAVKELTFKPGTQEGKPVKVQMSLPVTFRLPNVD